MRRASSLEDRLVEWGREYGGGRYGSFGGSSSPLASMMKWNGRPPSGLGYVSSCSSADEVQDAVEKVEKSEGGVILGLVLRKEYLTPGQPMESKLQRLRSEDGHSLQRTTYYKQLRKARKMVADEIGVTDDQEEEACAA